MNNINKIVDGLLNENDASIDPSFVSLMPEERMNARFVHGRNSVGSAEDSILSGIGRLFFKKSGVWFMSDPQVQWSKGWLRVTDPQFSTKIEKWYRMIMK